MANSPLSPDCHRSFQRNRGSKTGAHFPDKVSKESLLEARAVMVAKEQMVELEEADILTKAEYSKVITQDKRVARYHHESSESLLDQPHNSFRETPDCCRESNLVPPEAKFHLGHAPTPAAPGYRQTCQLLVRH